MDAGDTIVQHLNATPDSELSTAALTLETSVIYFQQEEQVYYCKIRALELNLHCVTGTTLGCSQFVESMHLYCSQVLCMATSLLQPGPHGLQPSPDCMHGLSIAARSCRLHAWPPLYRSQVLIACMACQSAET